MAIDSLTEGSLDGNGIFDLLMASAKAHLDAEYKKNRLSGDDYAKIYIGITQTVMQQAVQYALSEPTSTAQVALISAQREQTLTQTEILSVQRANAVIEGANLTKQGVRLDKDIELADLQKIKTTADTSLTNQQEANLLAESLNIPLQGLQIAAQTDSVEAETDRTITSKDLITQQIVNTQTENANALKQGSVLSNQILLGNEEITKAQSQITQMSAQTLLINSQSANATADGLNIPKQGTLIDNQVLKITEDILASSTNRTQITAQTALIVKENDKLTEEIQLITANISKTQSETGVMEQRKKTEMAQIVDVIDAVTVTGIIGRQKALYSAQTEGYSRDAEQKVLKTMVDVWSIQRTTNADKQPSPAGLADSEILKVVEKAKQGISVSEYVAP
jgi:hypothetical protein